MAPYRLTKRLMPLVQLAHQPDSAMLAGDPTAVRRRPVAVGGRNRIPGEEIKTHRNTLVGRLSCENDRILAQPGFAPEILRGSPWPPCWRGQRLSTRSSHKHLNPRTQRNHLQRHRNRQSIRSQTSNICSGQLLYIPILFWRSSCRRAHSRCKLFRQTAGWPATRPLRSGATSRKSMACRGTRQCKP
jgi:hypothetical protein